MVALPYALAGLGMPHLSWERDVHLIRTGSRLLRRSDALGVLSVQAAAGGAAQPGTYWYAVAQAVARHGGTWKGDGSFEVEMERVHAARMAARQITVAQAAVDAPARQGTCAAVGHASAAGGLLTTFGPRPLMSDAETLAAAWLHTHAEVAPPGRTCDACGLEAVVGHDRHCAASVAHRGRLHHAIVRLLARRLTRAGAGVRTNADHEHGLRPDLDVVGVDGVGLVELKTFMARTADAPFLDVCAQKRREAQDKYATLAWAEDKPLAVLVASMEGYMDPESARLLRKLQGCCAEDGVTDAPALLTAIGAEAARAEVWTRGANSERAWEHPAPVRVPPAGRASGCAPMPAWACTPAAPPAVMPPVVRRAAPARVLPPGRVTGVAPTPAWARTHVARPGGGSRWHH